MMKKVLYGVALTLLASVSVGSLQSCKDDVNDLKTQTSYDLSKLRSQVDSELLRLQGLIDANASDIAAIKRDYATVAYVDQKLTELENRVNGRLEDLEAKDEELVGLINGAISRLDTLEPIVTEHTNQIAELQGAVESQGESIQALYDALGYDPETGEYQVLKDIEQLQIENQELWQQLAQTNEMVGSLATILTELEEKVDALETKLDKVVERMDGLVTGILIQRVKSPVFGDFSLPIGVQSNLLFNWYGLSDQNRAYDFPTSEPGVSADGNAVTNLPSNAPKFNIPNGYFEDEVSLGKVYVTLNPVGHKFNKTNVTIVNSRGEALPFSVDLVPSDELLTFGYTRDEEINSVLYEGEAKVAKDDIDAVKVKIDENLVEAMKDAFKNPTKRNAASLLKAVYDQMSGMLPAYAFQYSWSIDGGDEYFSPNAYKVLSQYDLGVATARPLGFNFLADFPGSDAKVPTIGNIDNFIKELIDKSLKDLDIKGEDMEVLGHKIGFQNGKVTFDKVGEGADEGLVGTITGVTVDGKDLGEIKTEKFTEPADASDMVSAAIADAVIAEIGATSDEDQAAVKMSINIALLQLQKQINEVLANVNGQIKDAFSSMGDQAETYIDKVNRAVDLYNKIANKINNFLSNPNHYLQAAAFYETSSDLNIVSTNPNSPTVFENAGGDALSFYLSSYTGELIVPAYKKYVAVTGVVGESNADVSAYNKGVLNTVLDGSRIRVSVPALPAGKTYEFTYQAVDYRGFTSTQKFYIKVK